ncbi:MAG: right-handed parallel beta-helix repeat-containing protein, partial [Verrucomicrobiota bacterium]
MISTIIRTIIGTLALVATVATATDFYVAPTGNDANLGTHAKPFATPQHARDAIRVAKQQGDSGPFSVQLAGGLYLLTETLALTAEDSGTKAAPVVWRSAPNEQAVLSGGRALSGFRESTVNGVRRWTVELPEVKSGKQNFRQLFISTGGQPFERRFRPQIGMMQVAGLTDSPKRKNAPSYRAAQIDFYFAPGDFKPWENLSAVEVVVLHEWSLSRLFVEKVDATKNIVTFTAMPMFAVDQNKLKPYFIENVKEELKLPGQWYLDRPSGVLTYLPQAGETLANARVVVPRLVKLMTLAGDYLKGSFVEHLTFDNVAFSHNESPLPRGGYSGSQGNPDLPAAIELTGAKDCTFLRCTVSQTGNYGIGLGLGSQNNAVVGCRLFDLGGGGIKVGDIRMKADAQYPELPAGNRIENCAISDGGLMYFSANAVWGGIVRDTIVSHNQIWNFPYSGIAIGWAWHDKPTSCAGNRIEYNSISNVVTLICDGASIYTLGRQPGTVIRGNVVRDNVKSPFTINYWQLGLYLDEGSAEMLVENNFA